MATLPKKRYSVSKYGYTPGQDIVVDENFIEYFHTHSNEDVKKKFNISNKALMNICKYYNLKKSIAEAIAIGNKRRRGKTPWNKGLKKGDENYSCDGITEDVRQKKINVDARKK